MARLRLTLVAALVLSLSACYGNTGTLYVPPGGGSQFVLVPNYGVPDVVDEWNVTANGSVAPLHQIGASTLVGPTAVTTDAAGRVYVADFDGNAIDVFASGSYGTAAPIRTISGAGTGIDGPEGIGVDGSGEIYLSNRNGNSVTVYSAGASGNASPIRTLSGGSTTISGPQQLVVDSAGDITLADGSGGILYFAAGANGGVAPTWSISGGSTNIETAVGVAVDSAGNVYELNLAVGGSPGTINVFNAGLHGNVAPSRAITSSAIVFSEGIALDAHGNIYEADCGGTGAVNVFAASASGSSTPIQTITSSQLRCAAKPWIF